MRRAVCFVVQMGEVRWMEPTTAPTRSSGEALRRAARAGVQVAGPGLSMSGRTGWTSPDRWRCGCKRGRDGAPTGAPSLLLRHMKNEVGEEVIITPLRDR